jgi:uncharacterized protein (TIGR02246 family)
VTGGDEPLLAALAVRTVLERYCSLLDAGAVSDLLDLFEDDCTFTMMGRTYDGKSEFAAVWSTIARTERPSTLHALVNPDVSVDGDRATAVSGWILIDRTGTGGAAQVSLAGRYHDALRRSAENQWRFVSRRVETLARPQTAAAG